MVWGFQSFNPYGNLSRQEIQEIEKPGYWDVPGPSQIEGEYSSESMAEYMDNIEPIVITSEEAFMWWVQEIASYLTSLFLVIILIDKFIVKKEYTISSKEVGFMFLMLLKINFPIISIVTMCLSAPPALKAAQRWLKVNVNKRKELEAELRLMTQI
jgi:hypothetical protein